MQEAVTRVSWPRNSGHGAKELGKLGASLRNPDGRRGRNGEDQLGFWLALKEARPRGRRLQGS